MIAIEVIDRVNRRTLGNEPAGRIALTFRRRGP